MADSNNSTLREKLFKFKYPEIGDREEGYDGHYEWNSDDPIILEAIHDFQTAVRTRNPTLLLDILSSIVAGGEDGRLNAVINLLIDSLTSEESLKEALLVAITIGSRPMVEFILSLYNKFPYLERNGCSNSPNFSPHMTPLMLAAIMNHFSIVHCLLLRGHSIPIPHYPTCECYVCKRITVSTRSNIRTVDIMRAISSEAYLWLATDDVFASCCSISKDLKFLISHDGIEFIEVYRVLEANVQRFMARLSDMAWRSEEFNALMASKNHCETVMEKMSSPRIQMALNCQMKQFACTANVQTTMKSIFRADWYNIGNNRKRDLWRYCRCMMLFPFTSICNTFSKSNFRHVLIPFSRYVSHLVTYLLFLLAVIVRLFFKSDSLGSYIIDGYLYAYILGYTVEKLIMLQRIGYSLFVQCWWRVYDLLMITACLISLFCFIASKIEREAFDSTKVDRANWPSFDCRLMYEVSFAIACVIGMSKIFYYMQLLNGIGGSVISVGKCVGKVYTYLIIMLIVICSFSVGLNILTSPYNSRVYRDDPAGPGTASVHYGSLAPSIKNLFWSVFGYLGPSTYHYSVGNAGPDNSPVSHILQTTSLEILAAVYHGIIIITLMNLMTSLLVKKADEILDNEELEFKYTRAIIYSEFFSWEKISPPPFNLIHIFFSTGRHFMDLNKKKNQEDANVMRMNNVKFMETLRIIFDRFCASKECKYRSVWRSEYDKELHRLAHVQYLISNPNPRSVDNTYYQPKKRKEDEKSNKKLNYERKRCRKQQENDENNNNNRNDYNGIATPMPEQSSYAPN